MSNFVNLEMYFLTWYQVYISLVFNSEIRCITFKVLFTVCQIPLKRLVLCTRIDLNSSGKNQGKLREFEIEKMLGTLVFFKCIDFLNVI